MAIRPGALAMQPDPAGATTVAMAVRPATTPSPIAAQPIPAKSIAVLPLTNESGDKGQQYFSDGLSEGLITALSQFSGLKVISRDSSFRFRHSSDSSAAIGAKLGVAHLLEGSVQRAAAKCASAAARQSINLEPQQTLGYRELTFIEVLRGNATAALSAAQQTLPGCNHDIAMAWALQIGSKRAAADAAMQSLIAKHAGDSSYQIAEAYALRRDPDTVFKWLDQAWANRDNGIQYLIYDPMILRYQHDPRFAAFCKKVGLPTTTDAKALP